MYNFTPIGQVRSCFLDKFGTPRQPGLAPDARAFLELNPQVQPEISLQGLEGFSHLWVVFVFHKNSPGRFHAKVHPPRLNGETMGLFATRTPHRPNPIGLSMVEIDEITPRGIWVKGVDLIEGTPILDIKPYLPAVESIPEARAGWAEKNDRQSPQHLEITWSPDSLELVHEYDTLNPTRNIRNLIQQTLRLDPRPLVYKGYENQNSPYRESHAVRLYDLDIHFRFVSDTKIQINKIVQIKP